MYKKYIKRLLDIILSFIALIVFSIPLLIIALLVRIKIGSPIIFMQKRIGKDNKEFLLFKFRSMTEERDANGVYLSDDMRLVPFGKFIRKTSIDELPSLVNILRGDMSIIGPRPLPVRYLERYNDRQILRHKIRPGLSCPAIINGRNGQTWEEQFEQEVLYAENVGFWLDVKSIFNTIKIVLSAKGATSEDGGARKEFIGKADINSLQDIDGNYVKL